MRAGGGVAPGQHVGRQRLDMGLDFDVRAELVAHRLFEPARDVMRGGERLRALDFEIGRDRQLPGDRLHRDVVDGEPEVARDHHDAFAHGFVVERARLGRDRDFGRRQFGADGGGQLAP